MAENCVLLKGLMTSGGKEHQVSLSDSGLQWSIPSSKTEAPVTDLPWSDIYGVSSDNQGETTGASPTKKYFIIHFISKLKNKKWRATEKKFEVKEGSVTDWVTQIQAKYRPGTPHNLLVIVNPIGGKGEGRQIFEKKVAPLFKTAGINVQVQYTERAKHAVEIVNSFDFTKVDGMVTVGGDGLYQEAIDTLLQRTQKEAGIDINIPSAPLKPIEGLRFGVIPAGTGNGLAGFSCGGQIEVETSVMHIIQGETNNYNLFSIHAGNKFVTYCSLLLGYGMLSDIIKETDEKRWMKRFRYPYVMLKNMFGRKTEYMMDIEYLEACSQELPPSKEESEGAAALPPDKDWKKLERNKFMDVMGFVANFDTSGEKIVINPSSDVVTFILGKKCSGFKQIKFFIDIMATGKKEGLEAAHLTVLKNCVGLRINVPAEAVNDSNEKVQHILDVDGEVIHLEDLNMEIRLLSKAIPLFSSPTLLPAPSS